jgi:hypothetical protein
MRRVWLRIGFAACGLLARLQAEASDPAAEEAVLLARRLVEENMRLRAELADVRAERDELLARLAGERFETDRWTVAPERLPEAESAEVDLSPAGWRVVDANPELGLLALDAGARSGVRPGLSVAVVRGGAVIARARVVEVRERLSGARVEALATGRFPDAGDRAVVWRSRRE